MRSENDILSSIKSTIYSIDPKAIVILYGSYARGDSTPDSDIDLLILIDKDKLTAEDKINISYPLYDIEFETGQTISPLVLSRSDWKSLLYMAGR
jgi:uncharacterized protein